MGPQGKALDLISKISEAIPFDSPKSDTMGEMSRKTELHFNASKQCALIAVEEMLSQVNKIWGYKERRIDKETKEMYIEYWQQVKESIETITEP